MSTDVMVLLLEASVRAAAILAAGWTLAAFLRNASAATRHFTWVCTIVAAALVPVTATVAPDWTVRAPRQIGALTPALASRTVPISEQPAEDTALGASGPMGALPHTGTTAAAATARIDLTMALPVLWAAGTAAALFYVLLGASAIYALRRSARPVTADWLDEARALAEAFDVTPSVAFMESAAIRMPIACGVWRPAIVMPASARDWSPERRRVVLLHELAHVRRRDCLTQAVARLVCALYWFNPLTWIAARRLRAERERACDDFVLAAGTRGSVYAGHLLDIARAPGAGFSILASAGVPMAHRSQLEGRLMAILDPAVRRSSRVYARAAALMAIVLISVPVAALQPQEPVAPSPDVVLVPPVRMTGTVVLEQDGSVSLDMTVSENARGALDRAARQTRAALEAAAQPSTAPIQGASGAPGEFFVGDRRVRLERSRPERALDRALLEAAEEGDVQGINDLLAAGADVNAPVDGDGSALIVAARRGRVDIVRLLLDRGADPNLGVEGDGSAIIMAAREGHIPVVELLLQRGAYVNQPVDGDQNALIQASGAGRLEMVKLLVASGADVNARFLVARSRVVQTETEVYDDQGRIRVLPVRRLESRQEWRSALSMARAGGHDAVVAFLISVGAQE